MAIHEFSCVKCGKHDDRYIRLADYDKEIGKQKCDCGAHMNKVFTPVRLAGLDKGQFLAGRVENDGCSDNAMRARLKRNRRKAGVPETGGFFVGGLCRKGISEDPYAVCYSKAEVLEKARKLGRCVEGPGMDMESPISEEHLAKAEAPYRANPKQLIPDIIDKVNREYGGKIERKKFNQLLEAAVDRASGNG